MKRPVIQRSIKDTLPFESKKSIENRPGGVLADIFIRWQSLVIQKFCQKFNFFFKNFTFFRIFFSISKKIFLNFFSKFFFRLKKIFFWIFFQNKIFSLILSILWDCWKERLGFKNLLIQIGALGHFFSFETLWNLTPSLIS